MSLSDRPGDDSRDARHARQVQLLGQRTAEIVHDFNNLFQGIVGALSTLNAYLDDGRIDEARRLVADATAATVNAAAASRRLLDFVHREPTEIGPLDVNAVVRALAPLIRGALGETISLELRLGADVPPVVCERNALENALLNLVINARDAMTETGGALTLATDRSRTTADGPGGGDEVRITVADTGPGMTESVRRHVFEPFFTTKPKGRGTGLGLPMVADFVTRAGGRVDLVSTPGEGTAVSLLLPGRTDLAVTGPPQAAHRPAAGGVPTGAGRTVLVVEDEMVVRALIVAVLRERGYQVLEAADGTEGLDVLMSAQPIDLLISDIGLPGLGGREMAEVARAQRPGLPILFMTGHAPNTESPWLGTNAAMIVKPFTMEELAARAGVLLSGSA